MSAAEHLFSRPVTGRLGRTAILAGRRLTHDADLRPGPGAPMTEVPKQMTWHTKRMTRDARQVTGFLTRMTSLSKP